MKLDGRRQSTNVDDRRGRGGAAKMGGMGIGGLIVIGLITWLLGGNPLDVHSIAAQTNVYILTFPFSRL